MTSHTRRCSLSSSFLRLVLFGWGAGVSAAGYTSALLRYSSYTTGHQIEWNIYNLQAKSTEDSDDDNGDEDSDVDDE